MKKKLIFILVIAMTIIVLSINVLTTLAATKTELQNQNSEIQNKINETQNQIDEVEEEMSATMKQIQSLTAQISDYQIQINDLDGQIIELETSIAETQVKLDEAEANYAKQEEMLETRIVALYEAGETTYLDVLLNSSGLTDFISTYYMVSEVATYDTELLNQMEKTKNDIQAAKESLETSKKQIETVKANKENTANALQNSQSVKQSYVEELSEDEKTLQAELDQFEEDKREIQRQLSAIAAKEGGYSIGTPSSFGYVFPVAGLNKNNINNRNYPSYPGHTGVDVNINVRGKSIVAVKSGTVVISTALKNANGTYRSYGEYVAINHHDGTMTLYAHMLAGTRQVSVGQEVSQGQVLGTVGSTGKSTGLHLHFEVRVNGYCVNPLPYLP